MHDDATVCPHCRQEHPKAREARSRRRWRIIGISAAVVVGAFVFMIVIGSMISNDPHAFDGNNQKVYDAARLYGVSLTDDMADKLVFDIAQRADVSHSEAEDIVVECVKIHMTDNTSCENFVDAAKGLAHFRNEGVID